MLNYSKRAGFTIVELVIAMAIIAILASIVLVSYNGTTRRAHDTERMGSVTQIKLALERFHASNGEYPAVCPDEFNHCAADNLSDSLTPFLADLPDGLSEYNYFVNPNLRQGYYIEVPLLASPTCRTGVKMEAAWTSSVPRCD